MNTFLKLPKTSIERLFSWGILAIVTTPLLVLTYIGTFARYLGDDYSIASAVKTYGFWGAQLVWYQHITGKITYTFIAVCLSWLGTSSVFWLQVICLWTWVALLFFTFDYSFRILGLTVNRVWLAILAVITIFGAIVSFDDYSQVLHWQTNIIVYLSNSLAFTVIILYFARRFYLDPYQPVTGMDIFLVFIAFLLCGGLSQTWVIMQTTLLVLGVGSLVVVHDSNIRNNYIKLLSASMVGSLIAFLINFGSPGNVNLRDKDLYTFSFAWIFKTLFLSFTDTLSFIKGWAVGRPLIVVAIVIVSVLVGMYMASSTQQRIRKDQFISIFFVFVGSFGLFWMSFFPGFYVLGQRPPERALFTGMFIFIFGIALVFVYFGYWINCVAKQMVAQALKLLLYGGVIVLMAFLPLRTTITLIKSIPLYEHYAQVWDQRDLFLRQASASGQRDVTVVSFKYDPDFLGLSKKVWVIGDLEHNSNFWINKAAAEYYGLDSIAAKAK